MIFNFVAEEISRINITITVVVWPQKRHMINLADQECSVPSSPLHQRIFNTLKQGFETQRPKSVIVTQAAATDSR